EESPPQASAPALGFWAQEAGLGGGTVCASVGAAAIANSAPPIMPSVDRKIFFARRRAAPEPSIGSSLVSQDKSFSAFPEEGQHCRCCVGEITTRDAVPARRSNCWSISAIVRNGVERRLVRFNT